MIFGTIAAYIIFVTIPTEMARRSYEAAKTLGEDFRSIFQFTPEVKVNNTIVLNQQTPVFELSMLSQNFEHRYTWEHSWLGSTKRIFISGTFNAKVGFDLNQKFSITLRNDKAFVVLPQPETLSVESLGDIEYRDEQGIWNWVNTDNRTLATNAFIADARRYANRAAFVQDAKHQMERRITSLLKSHAEQVVITYGTQVKRR